MITPILERLFSLKGKAALVTGASGGIGRAFAIALSEAGAAVAIHGRDVQQLYETKRLIESSAGRAVPITADIADVDACRTLIADAHAALGRLDILINCAGMNRRKPIDSVTQDDFDDILAVNLRAALFLSQAAHPIMKAQGGGKIINIGSLTCSIGLGTVSVYGASKAGLLELTRTMAVEWAKENIQVNCLAPGFILTPLTEKALFADPSKRQWILSRTPMRRPGTPEDLIGTLLLLSSDASKFLTGQLITIDGGVLAGGSWEAD